MTLKVASKYLNQLIAAETPEVSKADEAKQTKAVEKLVKNTVSQKLPDYSNKVFAVGGFVRDGLMGKKPKDLDLVVDDPDKKMKGAEEFAKKFTNALGITSSGNPHPLNNDYGIWGVSLLHPKEGGKRKPFVYDGTDISGYVLELTPPRKEGPYDPKERKPKFVEYTDIKDDAKRRDLTINAIYKNIVTGEIKDPVDGTKDIKNKNLRPPEHPGGISKIYEEDPLRIMRLVRFMGKTGFKVDSKTTETIRKFMATPEGKKLVSDKISKERIQSEFEKILVGPNPAKGMELIKDLGFLSIISPDLEKLIDVYHDTVYHRGESVWEHTMDVLKDTPATLKARLGALFHDVGKLETYEEKGDRVHFHGHEEASAKMVDKILRDLKFPTSITKSVKNIAEGHMGFKSYKEQKGSKLLKKMRIFIEKMYDDFDDALAVMKADAKAVTEDREDDNYFEELKEEITKLKKDDIEKGLLIEKGGKYKYTSPLDGDVAKNLRKEFKEITNDKALGAILNKLKQMSMSGQFEKLDKEKGLDKAMKIVKGLVKNKEQLDAIISKFDKERKSKNFFKSAKRVAASFLKK